MIVVSGFNSAIDTVADAQEVRAGAVIRLTSVTAYPGGKGVHVAQTCGLLGEPVRLVGLVDAAHSRLFASVLAGRGVEFHGVPTQDSLRTCYAIRDAHGTVTELLEPGPVLDPHTFGQLEQAFLAATQTNSRGPARVVVLSGSLPASTGTSQASTAGRYAELISRLRDRVPDIVLDTSGDALIAGLAACPTVVKPNREEASRLIGREIDSIDTAFDAARTIARRGIRCVIISLGAEGAAVSWDGRLARIDVPLQIAVNAVGSGDCFVGGLAVALARETPMEEALRLAAACGAANALVREPGWCRRVDVDRLRGEVRVTWM